MLALEQSPLQGNGKSIQLVHMLVNQYPSELKEQYQLGFGDMQVK
jgi:hypothetical protein